MKVLHQLATPLLLATSVNAQSGILVDYGLFLVVNVDVDVVDATVLLSIFLTPDIARYRDHMIILSHPPPRHSARCPRLPQRPWSLPLPLLLLPRHQDVVACYSAHSPPLLPPPAVC